MCSWCANSSVLIEEHAVLSSGLVHIVSRGGGSLISSHLTNQDRKNALQMEAWQGIVLLC